MLSATKTDQPYHHGALREAALAAAVARLRGGDGDLPTVRELASGIGVTHRALYRYFADKDALRAAVAGQGFALMAAGMTGEAVVTPRGVMQAYLRFAFAEPGLYRLMFSLGSAVLMRDPDPGPQVREVIRIATEAFSNGDTADGTRDRVVSAWGMAHGLLELWRVGALTVAGPDRAAAFIMARLQATGQL